MTIRPCRLRSSRPSSTGSFGSSAPMTRRETSDRSSTATSRPSSTPGSTARVSGRRRREGRGVRPAPRLGREPHAVPVGLSRRADRVHPPRSSSLVRLGQPLLQSLRRVRRGSALWRRGAEEAMAAKKERPESVFVLTYEALVGNLEPTMRALSAWLGIEWDPLLLDRLQPIAHGSELELSHARDRRPAGSLDRWREVPGRRRHRANRSRKQLELDTAVRSIADVA